jgi:hypothetical protein
VDCWDAGSEVPAGVVAAVADIMGGQGAHIPEEPAKLARAPMDEHAECNTLVRGAHEYGRPGPEWQHAQMAPQHLYLFCAEQGRWELGQSHLHCCEAAT